MQEIIELANRVYNRNYTTGREDQSKAGKDVFVFKGLHTEMTILRTDFYCHVDEFNNPRKFKKQKYEN